jgi:sporulation protein YlmC with PRC-barrel domain
MILTYLTQLPVIHATGEHLGRVEDAILDLENGCVAYWRTSLGSRLRAVPLLITARRVAASDEAMTVHMNLDDLKAACEDAESATRHVDPAHLPVTLPLAGPLGHAGLSPIAFGFGRRASVDMPEGAPHSWIWGRDVLDKPLFTQRGELGRISDVEIDTAANSLTRVLVRGSHGETSFVEASALRHVPEERTHFVASSRPSPQMSA